jgi:hypothetical protein
VRIVETENPFGTRRFGDLGIEAYWEPSSSKTRALVIVGVVDSASTHRLSRM